MNAYANSDISSAQIASAIGEPARARMLYCLMDGHARTGTELAVVADVSPSTASVHLDKLKSVALVKVQIQGKHRYYNLSGHRVARVLEALSVLAGQPNRAFIPSTPKPLCAARTCYDHAAGRLGVALHDCFLARRWLRFVPGKTGAYQITSSGVEAYKTLGLDVDAARALRRRFAYPCLDWSERRPHLAGALGAAVLQLAFKKHWVQQELDSRALQITHVGKREMLTRFDVEIE